MDVFAVPELQFQGQVGVLQVQKGQAVQRLGGHAQALEQEEQLGLVVAKVAIILAEWEFFG